MVKFNFNPFDIWWWRYIFAKPDWYSKSYVSWPTRVWCRVRNHTCGPWWYNPKGFEPDMRCKNCGDDLG